jgi:hypothetical protein
MVRPTTVPLRVLSSLIEDDWLGKETVPSFVVISTTLASRRLSITTGQIHEALDWLQDREYISGFNWMGHYATIRLKDPA